MLPLAGRRADAPDRRGQRTQHVRRADRGFGADVDVVRADHAGAGGYIYATNDNLPNPYDTLPSYLSAEAGAGPSAVPWLSSPSGSVSFADCHPV